MVSVKVTPDESKSPFIFIESVIKVNSEIYVETLNEKVLSWVTEIFDGHYIPTMMQRVLQLFSFCRKTIWPYTSQNMNPTNFIVWFFLESNDFTHC